MLKRPLVPVTLLAVSLCVVATLRFASADERLKPSLPRIDMQGFANWTILVSFDPGDATVAQTVLTHASVIGVGGKRFLEGTVSDKFPDHSVVAAGLPAYVALDRITCIQVLESQGTANGG